MPMWFCTGKCNFAFFLFPHDVFHHKLLPNPSSTPKIYLSYSYVYAQEKGKPMSIENLCTNINSSPEMEQLCQMVCFFPWCRAVSSHACVGQYSTSCTRERRFRSLEFLISPLSEFQPYWHFLKSPPCPSLRKTVRLCLVSSFRCSNPETASRQQTKSSRGSPPLFPFSQRSKTSAA